MTINSCLCRNLPAKGTICNGVNFVELLCCHSYFLPGGAVDHGEHLTTAAIRETKEEAGIDINLTGVLSILYLPCGNIVLVHLQEFLIRVS